MENLEENLGNIDRQTAFEFDFFHWSENQKI